MATYNKKIDYVKENTTEEINKVIEQVNRALMDLNTRLVNISGRT